MRDWLKAMDEEDRRRIGVDIARVEFGYPIGMPTCRSLRRGLWEVGTDLTNNRIARVIFAVMDEERVLLHGFIKKSRATPAEDVDLARKRLKEIKP